MLTLPIFPFSTPVHCKLGSSALIPWPRSACEEPSAAGRRHKYVPASAAELGRAAALLAGRQIAWGCDSKVCGGRCKPTASLQERSMLPQEMDGHGGQFSLSADQFGRRVAIQIAHGDC